MKQFWIILIMMLLFCTFVLATDRRIGDISLTWTNAYERPQQFDGALTGGLPGTIQLISVTDYDDVSTSVGITHATVTATIWGASCEGFYAGSNVDLGHNSGTFTLLCANGNMIQGMIYGENDAGGNINGNYDSYIITPTPGAQGAKGDTGEQGLQGEQGIQGIPGEQGLKGDKGDQGEQGLQGEKGDTGDAGEPGIQGIQGDKGEKGDTGAIGPQGLQGPQGEIGPAGETGLMGAKGDKGDQGLTGDTGEVGPQGQKGDQGEPGTPGIQGEQGLKGDTGDAGPQGLKGDKGDNGDQGLQGIQGPIGSMGLVGPRGYQGIQGPQGIPGPKGDMGLQGPAVDLTPIFDRFYAIESVMSCARNYDGFASFWAFCSVSQCINGEKKCQDNGVQTCVDHQWVSTQTCAYGCTDGVCNAPPVPPKEVSLRTNTKGGYTDASTEIVTYPKNGNNLTCYKYYSFFTNYFVQFPPTISKTPEGYKVNTYYQGIILDKHPHPIFKVSTNCVTPTTIWSVDSYAQAGQEVYK